MVYYFSKVKYIRSIENYIPVGAIYFKTYMTLNALYGLLFFCCTPQLFLNLKKTYMTYMFIIFQHDENV
jgi:hypothetical protein